MDREGTVGDSFTWRTGGWTGSEKIAIGAIASESAILRSRDDNKSYSSFSLMIPLPYSASNHVTRHHRSSSISSAGR